MSMTRRGALIGGVALASAALAETPIAAATLPALSATAWRADLAALFAQLQEHHRDLFHHTPAARFRDAVARLDERIPRLQPFDIVAGFQAIVALAGDGHSFLFTWDLYRPLPFDTIWYADDNVRIARTTPAARDLLGLRLTRIDGMSMAEVGKRLDTVIAQAENRWYGLAQRPDRLRRAELLAALGVARSADLLTIEGVDDAGRVRRIDVAPLPAGTPDDSMTARLGPLVPRAPDPSFAWARLAGRDAVHLHFQGYADLPDRAAAFFRDIEAAPPRLLLIDLRENLGGNYTLPRAHIIDPLQQMPRLNRHGRLFVLIGRRTFSAAMTNASDFRRETEALLVGEPTGARPNGYQELHTFTLPHSGLRVACSIRRYRFDAADRDAVYPDLPVAPDWSAHAAGRDLAIEAALAAADRIARDGIAHRTRDGWSPTSALL